MRLKDRTIDSSEVDGVELGVDPGSKHTGIAVFTTQAAERRARFAIQLNHRGATIQKRLEQRAARRRAKWNRTRNHLPKTHTLDALAVGKLNSISETVSTVLIAACAGRGTHARTRPDPTRPDKHGFPRLRMARQKQHFGYQSGDLARAVVPTGKKQGPIPAASPSAPPAASTSPPPTGPSKASTIDTFVSSSEQTDTPTRRRGRRGLSPRAEARGFSPRYLMSVLTSEWLKIRSVRSTYLILGLSLGAALLGLALAVMAAHMYDSAPAIKRPSARIADLEEVVVIVPQLCMGVLGTLAITSEYVTGLIRTSLTIVPRRRPILAAKSTIVGTLGLLVGSMTVFGTYFVTRWVLGDRFSGAYTSAFLDRLPLLLTLALTVPTFALLGLGLGALLRSTAASIVILVGLVYVIPMIIGNIPEPWSERLGSLMIGALPREITGYIITTSVYGYLLPPAAAVAVLVAYAALPLVAAGWLLRRRDA
ncbi:RRXRR domain-containing protein [Nonomuraea sp. CA-141351]|uniref:RRXRR domain-containing protein n=1 Tax=Nonomuraea sp. CA-141351 TaxID=3239996 RepID=UPI003D8DA74C